MAVQHFLKERFAALNRGDYAAVYASYHNDAPFLEQFADRGTYLRFAKQQLGEIKVAGWQCLNQREVSPHHLEVILIMDLMVNGDSQVFAELALLIETDEGWRYHSAQKLGADDYRGDYAQLDFCHFDHASEKIRF